VKGVLTHEGSSRPATVDEVTSLLHGQQFFWLDLEGVDDETATLLEQTFGIHHLEVAGARAFHQRPKVEEGDDYTSMVAYGVLDEPKAPRLLEVHFLFAEHYVVTIHHGHCPPFESVRARVEQHHTGDVAAPPIALLYLLMDQLVDSYFPVLDRFDNSIDQLEDAILVRPTDGQLGRLFEMKRSLIAIRRVITPQRDVFAGISAGVTRIPGLDAQGERYLRDLYDHLIRISDLIDSYRDLLSGVMDTHLSTVSNRLNQVMKQLTIIATIFLPLSFLTGFFGQNFAVLVNGIRGRVAFGVLGIALDVACVVGLLYLFKKRGWLSQSD
jgi:magnesium transporter